VSHVAPPQKKLLRLEAGQAGAIADFCRALGARTVQLHGDVSRAELERLRERDPSLTIIKSLVVGRHAVSVLERLAVELAPLVDGFITDTDAPETGASGATGRTHDWAVSRRLVELSPKPVVLAGGLTPANVRQAIAAVRPAGVDVHTGVEDASDGRTGARCWPSSRRRGRAFASMGSGLRENRQPRTRAGQRPVSPMHHESACLMCSASRIASATIVSVGFA
jgi:phosphoribosylanthranilate isomerase